MKLYYLTPTKHVPSILRKGLVAGRGRGLTEYLYDDISKSFSKVVKGEKSTLYFTEDLESMGEFVSGMRYRVKSPRRFSILEVDMPSSSTVEPDVRQFGGGAGSLGGFLRSNVTRIPPSRVKVLGSVTIRPKGETVYNLGVATIKALQLGERSSEIAGKLEEPESEEEVVRTLEEIERLPEGSRAHRVAEERRERLELFENLREKFSRKK